MNISAHTVQTSSGMVRTESWSNRALTKPLLTFLTIVGVLSAIYYAFIAAPLYVSEARFTIHSQQVAAPTSLLAGLGGRDTGLADIVAVQDFIQSQEMLSALDSQFHLRAQYSRFRPDLFRWLRPNASDEAFLKFYRHMVVVKLIRDASIVEIEVRSFDRQTARPVAEAILQKTEAFVDGMTLRARSETYRSAEAELARARTAAESARAAIQTFRGAASSVDPAAAGAQVQGGESALAGQVAGLQAELASALTFNRPDSPAVRQLRARLASLQAQISRLKQQQGQGGTASQVTGYETLVIQRDAAERTLATAAANFQSARATAEQREKYVVRVVNPSQPDRPAQPRRVLDFFTVMLFALTGYALVSLLIAGIRDHRGA